MGEPDFLRYDQAAQRLSCSKDHITRLVQEGKLTRVNIGSSNKGARITRESLERFIVETKKRNGSDLHPD